MKQTIKRFSILIIIHLAFLSLTAFGQATSVSKEEFDKIIKTAFETSKSTFPRRETQSKPNEIRVFEEGKKEPIETVLNEAQIKEFLAKDKIRHKITKVTTTGSFVTERLEIGTTCYDSDGRTWSTTEIACDQDAYSIALKPEKREFFLKDSTLDSKPVKIYSRVETGKVYSDGKPPYISEYLYYLDSAGRILKIEYLTRKGAEKATLQNTTAYEYNVKIAPIKIPAATQKTANRKPA